MNEPNGLFACPGCMGDISFKEKKSSDVSCKSCDSLFRYDKDALVLSASVELN